MGVASHCLQISPIFKMISSTLLFQPKFKEKGLNRLKNHLLLPITQLLDPGYSPAQQKMQL